MLDDRVMPSPAICAHIAYCAEQAALNNVQKMIRSIVSGMPEDRNEEISDPQFEARKEYIQMICDAIMVIHDEIPSLARSKEEIEEKISLNKVDWYPEHADADPECQKCGGHGILDDGWYAPEFVVCQCTYS